MEDAVKVVLTRKPHECQSCPEPIPAKTKAVSVSYHHPVHGWLSDHWHLACYVRQQPVGTVQLMAQLR